MCDHEQTWSEQCWHWFSICLRPIVNSHRESEVHPNKVFKHIVCLMLCTTYNLCMWCSDGYLQVRSLILKVLSQNNLLEENGLVHLQIISAVYSKFNIFKAWEFKAQQKHIFKSSSCCFSVWTHALAVEKKGLKRPETGAIYEHNVVRHNSISLQGWWTIKWSMSLVNGHPLVFQQLKTSMNISSHGIPVQSLSAARGVQQRALRTSNPKALHTTSHVCNRYKPGKCYRVLFSCLSLMWYSYSSNLLIDLSQSLSSITSRCCKIQQSIQTKINK